MSKVNYDWVKDQFAKAKVKVAVGKSVLKMLETWETIELTKEDSKKALEILAKLGMTEALVQPSQGRWIVGQPGQFVVGDVVRVANDAFEAPLGTIHNGREGVVIAIRSGDIIVKTTDDGPLLDGAHYSPYKLEKRIG